jgi:hypothetical protein
LWSGRGSWGLGPICAAGYDGFCTANLSTLPAWNRAASLPLGHVIDGPPAGWRCAAPPLEHNETLDHVFDGHQVLADVADVAVVRVHARP